MDASGAALLSAAREAWEAEQWESAAERYEELLAAYPDEPKSHAWWFDAALAYKFLRNWPKAFELGRQAAARAELGVGDPAFWNLGIAATILGNWEAAREAWTGYGIKLTPGQGEIQEDFGTACVRLDTGETPEVVWVQRICPTRARVLSIPFSDRRFGEIVLHDGAPNGERVVNGRSHPVFDELLLWKASETPTWRASVTCPDPAALDALAEAFDAAGLAMESVAGMVVHSRTESEGSIELNPDGAAGGSHDLLLAAPDQAAASTLLDAWATASPGRSWHSLRQKSDSLAPSAPDHDHGEGGTHSVTPHAAWPFDGGTFPTDLGVVAQRSLLTGAESPRLVVHDHDGWWQALDGVSPPDPETAVIACMTCLVESHPELAELADLPPGWAAERDHPGEPWDRHEHAEDEEAE